MLHRHTIPSYKQEEKKYRSDLETNYVGQNFEVEQVRSTTAAYAGVLGVEIDRASDVFSQFTSGPSERGAKIQGVRPPWRVICVRVQYVPCFISPFWRPEFLRWLLDFLVKLPTSTLRQKLMSYLSLRNDSFVQHNLELSFHRF